MNVVKKLGRDDLAVVYIGETDSGKRIEFVESIAPPLPREKKWVVIISTLYGCPVKCPFCDAGDHYSGIISKYELLFQIDYLVKNRFGSNRVPSDQWKIQFARMGEPAYNMNVLDVLEELPSIYEAPGLMPSISTVAPNGRDKFFERLLDIKHRLYPQSFQFQFSLHTTDDDMRRRLIPVKTWNMLKIAEYGESIYNSGGRKITLNFALMKDVPVDPEVLAQFFNPALFIIKLTPLNPTFKAQKNKLNSLFTDEGEYVDIVQSLQDAGYTVILSIGELEENAIGSNCGQFVSAMGSQSAKLENSYSYKCQPV